MSFKFFISVNRLHYLFLGSWHGNDTENGDFDGSFNYLIEKGIWHAPVAEPIEEWENMIYVFPKDLWIYFGSTFIILGTIWIYIEYKFFNHDPIDLSFDLFGIFLEDCPPSLNYLQKSFRILWVFFSLIMVTAFQAQLISILTEPVYESQVKTLEEGVKRGFTFGFLPVLSNVLRADNTTISKEMLKKSTFCDIGMGCINRIIKQRDLIVARPERSTSYALETMYKESGGSALVYRLNNYVFIYGIHMLFTKGYPLFEKVNDILGILVQSGIVYKYDNEYKLDRDEDEFEEDLVILSLEQLAIPFILLIIGYILSIFVFIYEKKKS